MSWAATGRGRHGTHARRAPRGAATAELAMVLPLLVAVTLGLVWLLSVGAAQVRTVDAAREAARSAARGDPDATAVAAGVRVAPPGSSITLTRTDGQVTATAIGTVAGPGGLFRALPGVQVSASAVAAEEPEATGSSSMAPMDP